ncbi:hypothetical protein [Mesorhizobium sp. M0959]
MNSISIGMKPKISHTQGAWQRHLNEAGRWAAERVTKAITAEGAA